MEDRSEKFALEAANDRAQCDGEVNGIALGDGTKGEDERIQWHPAFRQAMRAELAEYGKRLTFIDEHPLTSEPLRVDLLVIKKPRNLDIKKNIGRIFRGHNVIEYKSPSDSFTVDDYSKAFAYAYLYAALEHVSPDDTTITIVASKRPRSLLRQLRSEARLAVEEADRGIHYIHGERMPVQIIEQKALSEAENLWLGSLRRGLPKKTLVRLMDESNQRRGDLGAFIFAVITANEKMVKGEIHMASLMKTLSEKPEFAEVLIKLGFISPNDIEKLGYINLNDAGKLGFVNLNDIEKLGFVNLNDVEKLGFVNLNDVEKLGFVNLNDVEKLGYINLNDIEKLGYINLNDVEKLGFVNLNDAGKLGLGNLVESARKLLKNGVSVDIVADSLGLSIASVELIQAGLEKEALAQTQDV